MLTITSFSPKGYEQYGRKCLETYVKFWPCPILVWYEEKPDFEHPLVEYRSLFEDPLRKFLNRLENMADTDGFINGRYNYNFDAKKFCRKVFAQEASFHLDDKIFWLDADTVTLKPIPASFLAGLVESFPLAYLGRRNSYTETGFLGFNTRHPDFQRFRDNYVIAYTKGRIFQHPRAWHDCIAFDMAREGIRGNDLNAKTPYQGLDHCWPHTVLGEYIQHNKGPARKDALYRAMAEDGIVAMPEEN